jgi:hypothetical protein
MVRNKAVVSLLHDVGAKPMPSTATLRSTSSTCPAPSKPNRRTAS